MFYSAHLELTSVGVCILIAVGLKQPYLVIDLKIRPLCMKVKSRQRLARVKLILTTYSFKIRVPDS